jgi:EF-P beta-lysylation protein EpmB
MITRTAVTWHTEDWQRQLSQVVSSVDELWQILDLPDEALAGARQAAQQFPLRIPRAFVAKMRQGDIHDPLLRQVLPLGEELSPPPGFVTDPLAERDSNPHQGLLHKYQSRVLVIAGSACAVHCRYCFRRHFPYQDNQLSQPQFDALLDYLRDHPEVNEVILSGGDPLVTSNARLQRWVEALESLPQLKRLRLHTRTPVVIPERIDAGLLQLLRQTRLKIIMVVHCNHANEIDDAFARAMGHLSDIGVTLLNQTVLLKGVNDDADALVALSETLFDAGILPYYVHLLDQVAGAHGFQVNDSEAFALYRAMAARLPGFLLPRLTREVPGAPAKQVLAPEL